MHFRPVDVLESIVSVTVLLFASYADALGTHSVSVDVPPDSTVADVLIAVSRYPGAGVLPGAPLVAVNQSYASPSTRVASGDEVALIPPVAGG